MSRGLIDKALDYLGNDESSYNTDTGGYCKLPNGTLIQWGTVAVAQNAWTANWNCHVPFTTKDGLGISLTPLQGVTTYMVNYSSSTTSQINIGRTPNSALSNFYIVAIGRWR